MNDLLAAIPGLAAHVTEVPPEPVVVVEFDEPRARDLISAGVMEAGRDYPPGALEWLRLNRTDIVTELRRRENAIDTAVAARDIEAVRSASDGYSRACQRAWEVFREATPSIEVESNLFGKVA